MRPHNASEEAAMMPDGETVPPPENKAVLPVATGDEEGDEKDLGDVVLTPTNTTEMDQTPTDGTVVDPWAHADNTESSVRNGGEQALAKRSFGERWDSFRNRLQTQWQNNRARKISDEQAAEVERAPQDKQAEGKNNPLFSRFLPKKPAAVAVDPSKLSAEEMAAFRASRISVTVQKESQDSKWGFGMEQHKDQPDRVRIGVMAGMGLLEHAPFEVGDTLISINNQKCTNAEATIQELVTMDAGIPVTLLVETPKGNPNLVQAMVQKPSEDFNLGIGFYIPADVEVVVDETNTNKDDAANGINGTNAETIANGDNDGKVEAPVSETADTGDVEKEGATQPTVVEDPTSKLLHINNLDANGLLSHSALSQGDIVVAINATPCSQMRPAEAEKLLLQSDDSVTIIAMKPPSEPTNRVQRWWRHAKRAGVAMGGGTMVGVGLVFIPTLPPPFGEVLIVGGVSMLGTEFEAPKRFMRSTRDSLERAVGREEKKDERKDGEDDVSKTGSTTTDGEGEDVATEAKPTAERTMGDRLKNFGRRHILPFLDHAVGDRKEEENEKEKESSSEKDTTEPGIPDAETTAEASESAAISKDEIPEAASEPTAAVVSKEIPPTRGEVAEKELPSS